MFFTLFRVHIMTISVVSIYIVCFPMLWPIQMLYINLTQHMLTQTLLFLLCLCLCLHFSCLDITFIHECIYRHLNQNTAVIKCTSAYIYSMLRVNWMVIFFRDSIRSTIERYKKASDNTNTHSVQEINAAVLFFLHLAILHYNITYRHIYDICVCIHDIV